MKDAGVGLVFLCFEKDAFEVSVCSAVVDNERNLKSGISGCCEDGTSYDGL